tara:strand:- start:131 stop:361 length:231 start_codon:yes stop_codon:yes gene_type:complete
MSDTEKSVRKTNYQTFYKEAIQNKKGYVTKDGTWAAIPVMGSNKKLAIIHNGEWVHTCRNFDSARSYILKESRKTK